MKERLAVVRREAWLVVAFLVFGLVLSTQAFSDDQVDWHKPGDYSKARILKEEQVDLAKALPPSPKPGSTIWKRDFKALHAWEKKRTKEQCEAGAHVVEISLKTFFGKPYGPLSDAEVAALDPLMDEVRWDVGHFTENAKNLYKRPRPYISDPTLKPCAKKEVNFAYPSGHTSMTRAIGKLLSIWDPKREKDFRKRADEVALGRIRVGVHHPSDIEGGKKIGDYLVKLYLKDPEFMKRFKALPKPGSIQ